MPEPWLRQTVPRGVELPCHPAIAAVLFALQQAEEDLERWTPPRTAYFHLRHIAGSLGRLTAYLEAQALTEEQLLALQSEEQDNGETREQLLSRCRVSFERTRQALLRLPEEEFAAPRYVGRKRIPTTAIGLAIHIAEHTQRHIGQIIAYSRLG